MIARENVKISSLTTMRIGGPARYVFEVEKLSDITDAYNFARLYNLQTFILGGGANTIGHDEGFFGVIIKNAMVGIEDKDGLLKIMGGTVWDDVVNYACSKGYTGIEALSSIPGRAGAAPVQNIGAYGQDISDTFVEAEVYDSKTSQFTVLKKDDFDFSYRKSILNTTEQNRYFVISITLQLQKGQMERPFYKSIEIYIDDHRETDFSPANIRKIVAAIREDKIPDPVIYPSAGSFFKNVYLKTDKDIRNAEKKEHPLHYGKDGVKINAGWLIEHSGLAGELIHGMRVSEKACLILVNDSATGYEDLAKARNEIIFKVYDKFGYWLEQEPVEIPAVKPPVITPPTAN